MVKIIKEETLFLHRETTYKLEVNGQKVSAVHIQKQDPVFDNCEDYVDILHSENLTNEEIKEIKEEITER